MRRPVLILTAIVLAAALAGGSFLLGRRMGPGGELAPIVDTAEEIRARSAQPVPLEELIRGAVRGMLEVLEDPHAAFLGPDQAADADELISGSYVGVGLWIEPADRGVRVASTLEGSPAREAGVAPGDLIARIDGRSVAGVSTAEAGALLAGAEGTMVTLMIDGPDGSRDLTLTRARISLAAVESRMLEGGVGYLRPLRFARGVADELRAGVGSLAGEGATAMVLDLRGNAGGLTDEAVAVAGLFLGDQPVATIRERGEERELRSEGEAATSLPVAVLVDGGTASAAELVAGALRDHGRASLVGTPTYGKGALLALSQVEGAGGSVRYTTGTFVTPDGHEVEGVGLVPDLAVLPGGPIDAQLDRAVRLLRGET